MDCEESVREALENSVRGALERNEFKVGYTESTLHDLSDPDLSVGGRARCMRVSLFPLNVTFDLPVPPAAGELDTNRKGIERTLGEIITSELRDPKLTAIANDVAVERCAQAGKFRFNSDASEIHLSNLARPPLGVFIDENGVCRPVFIQVIPDMPHVSYFHPIERIEASNSHAYVRVERREAERWMVQYTNARVELVPGRNFDPTYGCQRTVNPKQAAMFREGSWTFPKPNTPEWDLSEK